MNAMKLRWVPNVGSACAIAVNLFALVAGTLCLATQSRTALAAVSSAPAIIRPLPARAVLEPVRDCASLAQVDLTDIPGAPTSIGSARIEPSHGGRPEFCTVKGIISPQIQFELRLPTRTYTGRYLQGGCGGACGFVSQEVSPACDGQVVFGGAFAVAFENSGHVGTSMIDTAWALHAPALRADFAYRAAHVTSIVAKRIIALYYGHPPRYSYFDGCSDGGREGLKEAQMYPRDFKGIVVGAPAYWISLMPLRIIWESQHELDAQGRNILTPRSVALLHRAVIAACDALDGTKDGQIDDSRACHYDPRALICRPGQSDNCITPEQADAMRAFYSGPVDSQGRHLYLGGEPYGSELTWTQAFSSMGGTLAAEQIRFMIYDGKPPKGFDWRTWRPDAAALASLLKHGGYYDADDPDMRAFRSAGGKLIIWQGAADSAAGPYGMFYYYQRVRDRMGGFAGTDPFLRAFLVPGVYHCDGGYIPYQEDFLGAMVGWVERGEAPARVMAEAVLQGGTTRERPLFPYPIRAKYNGSGDVNLPGSFSPVKPAREPSDGYDWLGAGMK